MDNRHEPESCYRTQMEAVKASARLKGSVMDEVRRERCAAEAAARAESPGGAGGGRAAHGDGDVRGRLMRHAGHQIACSQLQDEVAGGVGWAQRRGRADVRGAG